jgi:hypothetical protein
MNAATTLRLRLRRAFSQDVLADYISKSTALVLADYIYGK